MEILDGLGAVISGCRSFADLPAAAQAYIIALEKLAGCRITYVSVGAGRDEYLVR